MKITHFTGELIPNIGFIIPCEVLQDYGLDQPETITLTHFSLEDDETIEDTELAGVHTDHVMLHFEQSEDDMIADEEVLSCEDILDIVLEETDSLHDKLDALIEFLSDLVTTLFDEEGENNENKETDL